MVEFIHSLTGSKMLVAENRVEEYKAAGHKLAAKNSKANKKDPEKEKAEEPEKEKSAEKVESAESEKTDVNSEE